MSQLDYLRSTLGRKREEVVKLQYDLAGEQSKISTLEKTIISASDAIGRTKNMSTIKSKQAEIMRTQKTIADTNKKIADKRKQIAQKEKEINAADDACRKEEDRLRKKDMEDDKKRRLEDARKTASMERSLKEHKCIQFQMKKDIERLQAIPQKITVLFLAANPSGTSQLSLDEESRSIQEKIRLSEYRDSIHFESRWAVRPSDIFQAINEANPTIVHFSGHGTETGDLVLSNPDNTVKMVAKEAITAAMATVSDAIRLVVFNTCFSEAQAIDVVEHIESAIGMSDSISDDAACTFAAQLYSSIGFGRSLQSSFKQAVAGLLLENIPGENIPKIYSRHDVNLDDLILVDPNIG